MKRVAVGTRGAVEELALIALVVTVLGGVTLATLWARRGGPDQPQDESTGASRPRIAVPLLIPHALIAIAVLIIWTVYVARGDTIGMSYTPGFVAGALVVVIALGLTMLRRWFRARRGEGVGGEAERRMPAALVALHRLAAAATFALVLVTVFD
jgi:hypothetical protein